MRAHGRAQVDSFSPRAFGVCDKCGFLYNLHVLRWQFDFAGPKLQNLRLLVCQPCYDTPQPQKKPIIIPQDPVPVQNARIENYTQSRTDYRVTQDGDIRTTSTDQPRVVQSSQWVSFTTTGASGTGTVATLTYNGSARTVGTTITVTGVVPTLYNGTFTVTASSSGSVSYASVATGAQISAGTIISPDTLAGPP